MLHHELLQIPPIVTTGLFSLGAAAVTGLFSWLGGERSGKDRFINAIKEAAQLAIEILEDRMGELRTMHQECLDRHGECENNVALLQQQIDDLLIGRVPVYHVNKKTPDMKD